MARVLLGTAPQIRPTQRDTAPATAWIEAHYDELRGQWVAVRLDAPDLVARALTLKALFESVPSDDLNDCLVQYLYTTEQEHATSGPGW